MGKNPKNPSQKAKTSARERMRAERARQEKRARIRRQAIVGVSVAAVLALAAGLGIALSGAGDEDSAGKPLVVPANTTGPGGTVITYGDPKEKNTLKIYEDPRCPYCAKFEQANGATVKKLADEGKYKVEYHFATFLDNNLGGQGSKRALNALGAAVNEGTDKFMAYHQVLYANHPNESDDAFADTSHLLDLASRVKGLRTPEFDKAVKELTYLPWVEKVSAEFDKSGVTGTPTVVLNGKRLEVINDRGAISPQQFTALVEKELGGK